MSVTETEIVSRDAINEVFSYFVNILENGSCEDIEVLISQLNKSSNCKIETLEYLIKNI